MHELSICVALVRRVEAVASRERGRVSAVRIVLGPLSGVEPELLARAFHAACAGGWIDGAELLIERVPVRVQCLECRHEAESAPNDLTCAACRSERTRLLSGDELLLTGIDLVPSGIQAECRAPAALHARN